MTTQSAERLHALDAVRGGALLLGIAVHMGMSFSPIPIWPIRDNTSSNELLIGFLVLHIFRMSLFFVIAGFFARMLLQKRGAVGFLRDRAMRIGVPFIIGWPILYATCLAVIGANGSAMFEQPALTLQTLPLLHIWFLYALLWLYVGALAVSGLFSLLDRQGEVGRYFDPIVAIIVKSQLAPIVLSAPLAATFFFEGTWIRWGGVQTPDVGLVPNMPACVAFVTAFGFGWILHRQPDLLNVWKKWWPLHLTIAATLSVLILQYAGLGQGPTVPLQLSLTDNLISSAIYPLAIWAWTFGLIGIAIAFLSGENKVIRYVADSSYWIYLIHLPVVLVFQMLFSNVRLAWFIKFPIMLTLSFAIAFASYQFLVRNTPIGTLLNGRRYKRPSITPTEAAQPGLSLP